MKYLSLLFSLLLSYSCYAQDDTNPVDVIKVTVPSSKIISATIEDCSNPKLVVTNKKGSMSFEVDASVDCENVRRALFLAGSRDDINGVSFKVNLVFDKSDFLFVHAEYHQGNKFLAFEDVQELFAENTMR